MPRAEVIDLTAEHGGIDHGVVLGALFARVAGRDWRSPARWGSGPGILALVASALVFSALPGHVEQMSGATSVVPFASLAIVLGYAVLRTGSVLPAIVAHVLLDLTALAYLGGHIGTDARVVMGAATLVGLASGAMLAGRRLGVHAPHAEEHERAEGAVVGDADERLHAGRRHGLHERAGERPAELRAHGIERVAHRRRVGQAQSHATDVGLVHDGRRRDLERD